MLTKASLTARDFVVRRLYNPNCPTANGVQGGQEGLNSWILLRNPGSPLIYNQMGSAGEYLIECAVLSDDVPTMYSPSCGGQEGKMNAFPIPNARIHVDGDWNDQGKSKYTLAQHGDAVTSSGSYGSATGKFVGPYTFTMSWPTATWIGTVDPTGESISWNNGSKWLKEHE